MLSEVISDAAQGSVLGSLLFNVFIIDFCNSIKYSRHFLFADDSTIFCTIISATDYILLQSYIDSICSWHAANSMKLSNEKTRVITFTRKTNKSIIITDGVIQVYLAWTP